MAIVGVNLDYKAVIVAALVGAAAVWTMKRTASAALDALPNAVEGTAAAIVNPENPVNRSFNTVWEAVSGSKEDFGADMYDLLKTGSIHGDPSK